MGYKELSLISDVLSHMSEEGLDRVEFEFNNFLEAIT